MIIHNDCFQQSITVSIDKQQEISSICNNPLHWHKAACGLTHLLNIYSPATLFLTSARY